jgi:hypothetical protein
VKAAERVCRETIGTPRFAVVAGSGEFLAHRLARAVLAPNSSIKSAAQKWGRDASTAGCAWALLKLASEWSMADHE